VPTVDVYFIGTFPENSLTLGPTTFIGPTMLTIHGEAPTVLASGTVSAYQAFNPAGNVRARLTDGTADFSVLKRQRLRMTSGGSAGAVAWVTSLGGGNTVANISHLWSPPSGANFFLGASAANPVPGDGYDVEHVVTFFAKHNIQLQGRVHVGVRDLGFIAGPFDPASSERNISNSDTGNRGNLVFYGCEYDHTAFVYSATGKFSHVACGFIGDAWGFFYQACNANEYANYYSASSQVVDGSFVPAQCNVHDGDGVRNVARANEDSWSTDVGHRAFFGNVNGTFNHHYHLFNFGTWTAETSSALVWGSDGNTVTAAFYVANGCGAHYAVKPTAVGGAPGNDVVLANEAPLAWAAIPAKASTATNNAYLLQRL